ncbi:hypothetical protein BTHE68_34060 [Burkholderia sp. THE68]|nr:hypothetical protein BTHE68_34060 [Burkholderia sp. THE68]
MRGGDVLLYDELSLMRRGHLDMARRFTSRLACVIVGACAWSCAVAAPDDDPSTVVSDVHEFVVAADGSLTEDDIAVLRANTAAGVDEIAQRYVWYDKSVSQVDIVEAFTVDANGCATMSPRTRSATFRSRARRARRPFRTPNCAR